MIFEAPDKLQCLAVYFANIGILSLMGVKDRRGDISHCLRLQSLKSQLVEQL